MVKLSINAVTNYSGGGATVLLGYLGAWHKMGADLEITVHSSQPSLIDRIRQTRPEVQVVPFGIDVRLPRRLALQYLSLGRSIESMGGEVALSTNFPIARCRMPQIVQHQNLLLFEHRSLLRSWRRGTKNLLQAFHARRSLDRVAANVFISGYLRNEAERINPSSRARNHVISNGLTDDVLDRVGRASEWNGEPRLLAVTSDEPSKENETLARVLAHLVARHPGVDWSLHVAGAGRFERERLLAGELGVADRIRWLGHVDARELESLYRRAVCLLYTSPLEGFGLPPIEAMARGCPVVASDCTAIPEVVGDAGLLVEPGNVRQFADAAIRLLDKRGLRDELIERGAGRAARFRWSESAARFYRLIGTVAHRATASGA